MVFEVLFFLILASATTVVIIEHRRPDIALFWLLLLTLLPVVGLVLFFIFGRDHRSHRVIKDDEMRQLTALRDQANRPSIATYMHEGDKYSKLAAMMLTTNNTPVFDGNSVQIYTDFSPMFDAMLADIASATKYVHIQFYKIEDDEVGRQLATLLVQKAQEGVDVRLMFDSFANLTIRNRFYNQMRYGGVQVQSFLKFIPAIFHRDVNCRTHRKIVVVDGQVGYTGGMNIARRYRDGIHHGVWRDTHVRLQGPAVSQLEVALLADWRFCTKQLLAQPLYFPPVERQAANAQCQVVTSSPIDKWHTVMQGMVQVIAQSRRYLYIQSPYFIPTAPILLALRNAAVAGVDVRLMLPQRGDRGRIMLWASQSYFNEILEAGVKIYLYTNGYLHAKTMVADDDFVTIGSTNIDSRSFEQNFEANAFIYNATLAHQQREIFLRDAEHCTTVDPTQWQQRRFVQRWLQGMSRLLTPLL